MWTFYAPNIFRKQIWLCKHLNGKKLQNGEQIYQYLVPKSGVLNLKIYIFCIFMPILKLFIKLAPDLRWL